ncbi:MAG: histidine phosphatase family protein [Defluviitaleaceae bacterium]|nr:histidine phosphatase family protein [Defluviitaleaceae bacterium]
MRITTIRHGETDWNVAKKLQGSVDIPLNKAGLNQAERLAERLSSEPCDIIYTSDLMRAKKTAEIINSRHNVELVTTPNLREAGFGEFEGQCIADEKVRKAFGAYMDVHVHAYFAKVHAYLGEILRNDYKNIFLVGHFGTVRAILCLLLKIPAEKRGVYTIGNTAIHTFERDENGEFHMSLENDTAHLIDYDRTFEEKFQK